MLRNVMLTLDPSALGTSEVTSGYRGTRECDASMSGIPENRDISASAYRKHMGKPRYLGGRRTRVNLSNCSGTGSASLHKPNSLSNRLTDGGTSHGSQQYHDTYFPEGEMLLQVRATTSNFEVF
ncbi:hypothetical protein Bbelb_394150 [Branchiostoma belcheri]|nr:hypothetical protein Bbelb_394150 [Branchiostoma belcheri]